VQACNNVVNALVLCNNPYLLLPLNSKKNKICIIQILAIFVGEHYSRKYKHASYLANSVICWASTRGGDTCLANEQKNVGEEDDPKLQSSDDAVEDRRLSDWWRLIEEPDHETDTDWQTTVEHDDDVWDDVRSVDLLDLTEQNTHAHLSLANQQTLTLLMEVIKLHYNHVTVHWR